MSVGPSVELLEALQAAGWTKGREQSAVVAEWRKRLEGAGYHWVPAAEALLSEFGGLRLKTVGLRLSDGVVRRYSFGFDPLEAEGTGYIEDFEALTGIRLCPIGYVEDGRGYVAMDDSGTVYLLASDGLRSLGREPTPVLERLLRGDDGILAYPITP